MSNAIIILGVCNVICSPYDHEPLNRSVITAQVCKQLNFNGEKVVRYIVVTNGRHEMVKIFCSNEAIFN